MGCFSGDGGIQLLGRMIGNGCAMWYLLTGESIDAFEALLLCIVNKVVPLFELLESCLGVLHNTFLKKAPTRSLGYWEIV